MGDSFQGKTAVITGAFVERLGTKADTGAQVQTPGNATEGQSAVMHADHPVAPRARGTSEFFTGYFYQWFKDGEMLYESHEQDLVIDPVLPEHSGEYACWIYDHRGFYEMTERVILHVEPAGPNASAAWRLYR